MLTFPVSPLSICCWFPVEGLQSEGIYRVPGIKSEVQALNAELNRGTAPVLHTMCFRTVWALISIHVFILCVAWKTCDLDN